MEEKKLEVVQKKRIGLIIFVLFFLVFIAPILYFLANLSLAFWGIRETEAALKNGNFKSAKENVFIAQGSLGRAQDFFENSKPAFSLFGLNEKFEKINNLFSLAEVLGEGADQAILATEQGSQILTGILTGANTDFQEPLKKIKTELEFSFEKISLAQSLLNDTSGQEPIVGPYINKLKTQLPPFRLFLSQAKEGIDVLPEILAVNEQKTYLVLLQNNMELRPTGGFIGSYGLLTLKNGKIIDFQVQDVYWADGQLRGHVEPPPKMKAFLGTDGWFLRDSNWDPDFPTTAARAEWFLEKEIGRQVDGVIGVNLFASQRILKVFGEVTLPDYGEKINAQNFFERALFHSEVGFFPGSTAKKDFLGAATSAVFERLENAKSKELTQLILSFYQSVLEKEVMVYLNDENSEKLLSRLNWSGDMKSGGCAGMGVNCAEDYLMVVDANLGVNKSNYYLEKSLDLKTKINEDGTIEKDLTIFYQNKSPSQIFPAGNYRNYLRVYVPQDSSLESIVIRDSSGEEVGPGATEKPEITSEHGKTVFGFPVDVPVKDKRVVELHWKLPQTFSEGKYLFLLQKQSGTRNDYLTLTFSYPPQMKVFSKIPGSLTASGNLYYNDTLSQDLVFDLNLSR